MSPLFSPQKVIWHLKILYSISKYVAYAALPSLPLCFTSFPFSLFLSLQVVMAVAQLYFHLAPKAEVGVIAKALVRLMRSHRSVKEEQHFALG